MLQQNKNSGAFSNGSAASYKLKTYYINIIHRIDIDTGEIIDKETAKLYYEKIRTTTDVKYQTKKTHNYVYTERTATIVHEYRKNRQLTIF